MAYRETRTQERRVDATRFPRVRRLLRVGPGEGAAVGWTTALFALSQANQGLGINAADALFFLRFGVEFLPAMILLSGPVVMVFILLFAGGLGRIGAARWLPMAFVGSAAVLVLERLGIAVDLPGIYPVVWLMGQVVMTLSLTAMWTGAGEVYTTRQAKRLFPLFASAGIAGGVVGNAATGPLAQLLGTSNLLLVQAALLVGAAAVATALAARFFASSPEEGRISVRTHLRAGYELTVASPMLRMVAGVGAALSALLFLVVFPFSQVVTSSFPSETEVASYLGYFSAAATAATFLVSLLATNRLFARFGVVATLVAVPLVYLAGFSVWLASFGLVTATLVRGLQFVAVNAIGETAWSSLFNVLPSRRRGQVMAFMAAGPRQLGVMLSGALLLAGSALPREARTLVGLLAAAATVLLVARMRGAYGNALVEAVRNGMVDVFSAPAAGMQKPALDADTALAMSACLEDSRPRVRAMAVAALGRVDAEEQSDTILREALDDEDPRVRMAVLDLLADRNWREFLPRLLADPDHRIRFRTLELLSEDGSAELPEPARLLGDPHPPVRAMAAAIEGGESGRLVLDALFHSGQPEQVIGALTALRRRLELADTVPIQLLEHPDRRVRAAAAPVVAARPGTAASVRALLDDSSTLVRRAAADGLTRTEEGVETLLEVLQVGSVRSTDAALHALSAGGRGGPGLAEWATGEIERAAFLRRHRLALEPLSGSMPGVSHLIWLLEVREERLERWAVTALITPDTRTALDTVMRGLWSDDNETRSQAMEALDSIGDRSVVGGLLSLLEEDPVVVGVESRTSLRELSADHDPWIRALAYRCLRDLLMEDVGQLVEAALSDPSPLVQDALAGWEPPTMQVTNTLDMLERVLALQRVPLFADVDPEDLERIAHVVTERHYQPDELVFRQGEEGDECLLIVSGEVAVAADRDGQMVPIRNYGPGEHVGELALLRGRPRASDVTAGPDGVQCLALHNSQLQAILEERPQVAMAMLGTLAERLATM